MRLLSVAVLLFSSLRPGLGADWPTYRADAERSGYTAKSLARGLKETWTIRESHPPAPAWPTSRRLVYDRVHRLVIADGRLFYGTSADDRLVCRDASTGVHCWTFVADAPLRLAPALAEGRVFVASDDGRLYCLQAADGRLLWQHRAGPRDDRLLGNQRMIARWPARGGPVVHGSNVYYAAGIWPSDGIYLYALDATTGRVLWCNDSSGSLELDQPHPTARAKSGAAAQGHLAIAGDHLLMPTGRAVPAAFRLEDGAFRYLHLQVNRAVGGSEVVAFDRFFINGGTLFNLEDGKAAGVLGMAVGKKGDPVVHSYVTDARAAVHPRWLFFANENRLAALNRARLLVAKESIDRKGRKATTRRLAEPAWLCTLPVQEVASVIAAGDNVVVGADNRVLQLDAASGSLRWSAKVNGTAAELAAAGGRLYVSTDQGEIACFGLESAAKPAPRSRPAAAQSDPLTAQAAEEILRRSGVRHGYALDLACGDGQLAMELARKSSLRIYAVDADARNVETARKRLAAAGLYGVRVTVHLADHARVPYPNYFADLVCSSRSLAGSGIDAKAAERMLRPYGGALCLGPPGAMQVTIRGPLEGAGQWTHQYADPANTLCSADLRLRRPLEMLWFRDADLPMPSRHGRGPSPLVARGRMIVEGLDALRAVNLYNGTTLWEVPLPRVLASYHQDHLTGVAATGSNLCLADDRVLVHRGSECLVLDLETGRELTRWKTPQQDGRPGTWGYLACDGGRVFGTLANVKHQVTESWRAFLGKLDMSRLYGESSALFCLEAKTGRLQWLYRAEHSIRHNAIAVGGGRVYLIDRPLARGDTPGAALGATKPGHPGGRLLCLNADTGKRLWQSGEDVFGTLLALSQDQNVLLMGYQPSAFKLDSELGGRMAAYHAGDGTRLWQTQAKYKSRPLIHGRAIVAEPGKWDLLSGRTLEFDFSRSYGCGILAASSRLLVFRSATLGYYDLEANCGTENYGGIRPGCWVNAIPAGGLVVMADAASWCTCSYLNQAMIALQPRP